MKIKLSIYHVLSLRHLLKLSKVWFGSELDYVLYSCFTNHRIMKRPETVYLLFLGVEQLFYSSST